jgi:hypothetical protein
MNDAQMGGSVSRPPDSLPVSLPEESLYPRVIFLPAVDISKKSALFTNHESRNTIP